MVIKCPMTLSPPRPLALDYSVHMNPEATAQTATAHAISDVAGRLTVLGGGGTAVYGAITSEWLFAFIGAVCAVGTFAVNAYFKRRAALLDERRAAFEMELSRAAEERRERLAQASIDAIKAGNSTFNPLRDSSLGGL